MAAYRVFVVWIHPLFHTSVRLLLKHPEVEWVGASSDYATAKEEILRLQPDIILIESPGEAVPKGVMDILEASSWNVRIFGMNLSDNKLSIYHREQWIMGKADDLLHLIQSDVSHQ